MADADQRLRVLALFLSCAILHLIMRRQLRRARPARTSSTADDDLSLDAIARAAARRLAAQIGRRRQAALLHARRRRFEFGFRFVSEIDVAGAAGMALPRDRPHPGVEHLRGGRDCPPRLADRAVGAGDPRCRGRCRHLVRLHATTASGATAALCATPRRRRTFPKAATRGARARATAAAALGVGKLVPLPEAVAGVPRTAPTS